MPHLKVFWQQVTVYLKKPLKYLLNYRNIKNTAFNTNIEEFPLEIIHFILLFTNLSIIFTAVNGLIICQQLKL